MKVQVTRKEIMQTGKKVYKTGFCNLQHLLTYETPFADWCGIDGWYCDLYEIDGIIITTGYKPFGNSLPYEIVREYDKKAEIMLCNHRHSKKDFDSLIRCFLKKAVVKQ